MLWNRHILWLLFLQFNLVCCGLYKSNFSLLLMLLKLKNVAECMQLPGQPLWHACQALRTYEPFFCLDGPALQATTSFFQWSHCRAAPMETHLELFKLSPKNAIFKSDCSFTSYIKVAVINRSGWVRGSVKRCHSKSLNIDSFPFHSF